MNQPGFVDVACNFCQSRDARELFVSPGWEKGQIRENCFRAADDVYGDYGRMVKCRGCGLVYTNPRLDREKLLEAYAKTEDHDYMGEDASRSINGFFNLNTITQFATSGKLLDVGCSTGYFLNAARLHFDVMGIEPNPWAAEFAKGQLKLDVRVGTLEQASFPAGTFDVVTLADVIEHFEDPMASLKEIHRVLKPGGLIYVVTPDISSWTAKLMGGRWWGLRPAHIYCFSPKTIKKCLEAAGFDVVLTRSYGRVFSLDYWLSRMRNYSRLLNRFLQWCIRRPGLGRKLVYVNTLDSMECVGRKRGDH